MKLAALLSLATVPHAGAYHAPVTPLDAIQVDPATGHYVDSHGRTRIFHGVNVVEKLAPWYPRYDKFNTENSLDETTMQNLEKWGFNVVRLGVMWPGVETGAGEINQNYLKTVSHLAQGLASHRVYTIADLHQDVGSRRFCGEGFPEHYVEALLKDPNSRVSKARPFPFPAVQKSKLPMNASGFPAISDCVKNQFAEYYMTEQVGALWGELYTPGSALNKGFSRFWGAVAETFKEAPHLLAYELLNEPSGFCLEGTALSCLASLQELVGSKVDAEKLTPLYRAAAAAIRGVGAKQPILYEATVLPKIGSAVFPEPALGNDPQQGLAYHIYCAPGDGNGTAADLFCQAALKLYEHTYYAFMRDHKGVGGFMTEFGAVGGNPGELKYLNQLMAAQDEYFQSWAYWQLKKYDDFTTANAGESLYDENGELEVEKLKTLSRTYAPAIAGIPTKMAFDPATCKFELDFRATVAGQPTEVYLNEELHYENGYNLEVKPDILTVAKPSANHIHLTLPQGKEGQTIHVTITKKDSAISEVIV